MLMKRDNFAVSMLVAALVLYRDAYCRHTISTAANADSFITISNGALGKLHICFYFVLRICTNE